MAGGPHIDLLGWRHGQSVPRELVRGNRGYRLLRPGRQGAFPPSTPRELARALQAELRRQRLEPDEIALWLVAVRRCRSVRSYPCDVGVSHVVVRVLTPDRRPLAELVLEVPLGC